MVGCHGENANGFFDDDDLRVFVYDSHEFRTEFAFGLAFGYFDELSGCEFEVELADYFAVHAYASTGKYGFGAAVAYAVECTLDEFEESGGFFYFERGISKS